jgi:hypothetical protein
MGSAVVVIAVCGLIAWLAVVAITKVRLFVTTIRERAYLVWIALAVIVGLILVARR